MPKVTSAFELTLGERPSGSKLLTWLHLELRSAILDGRLRAGTRMPATRDFADQYGVSRGSALAVYQRLQDEGFLTCRHGAGTWVIEPSAQQARASKNPSVRCAISPPRLEGLTWTLPPRPFQYGPDVNEFPKRIWSRIAARRMRSISSDQLHGCGDGRGYAPLCAVLAHYLGSVRGVNCVPEQIVIVSGIQQGLDLLARLLTQPADPVWMEDPGYFGAIDAFAGAGAHLVPVRVDQEGLDVALGRRLAERARVAYLTPTHQFPLGVVMSRQRRLAVLEWARSADAYVVEDDYDSELRFAVPTVPALHTLDRHERVIVVGSFNKLLFPSMRLGYLVLPRGLVDDFLALRLRTDSHPVGIDQGVLFEFIEEGHLGRHMRRMRELYASRLEALKSAAERYLQGLLDISPVRAGLHTTGFLRNDMTSQEAENAAAAHGVSVQALSRHRLEREDLRGVLLGFAAFSEDAILEGVAKLAGALERGAAGGRG